MNGEEICERRLKTDKRFRVRDRPEDGRVFQLKDGPRLCEFPTCLYWFVAFLPLIFCLLSKKEPHLFNQFQYTGYLVHG